MLSTTSSNAHSAKSLPRSRWSVRTAMLGLLILAPRLAAQTSDVTPPTLLSLAFSPAQIDVRTGAAQVSITAQATDDIAGISGVNVMFTSPSGGVTIQTLLTLSSGTILNGTFTGLATFPQFSEAGTWTVSNVLTADFASNVAFIGTPVLVSQGFPTQLQVVSVSDTQGPTFNSVVISPAAVDVSSSDQTLSVDVQVSDDVSGAALTPCTGTSGQRTFIVTLRSPSGAQNRFTASNAFTLVSGDRLHGLWHGTMKMPRYSEAGAWQIQSMSVVDCVGNVRNYTEAQVTAANLQQTVTVTSNPSDTQGPTLTSLSVIPIAVNTAIGPQTLHFQIGISDDLSGADFSPDTPTLSTTSWQIVIRSPSGAQARGIGPFDAVTLVSGTRLNGVWDVSTTLPQFAEAGTWRIQTVRIKDATRNIVALTNAQLQAAGVASTFDVIKPSLVTDGVAIPGSRTPVEDQTFGSRASISFPSNALTVPTQVAIDVLSEPLDIPNPTGFSGPGSYFVNISLTPEPAFPVPAPGMIITLPLRDPMIPGTTLNLYKIDVATGQLVPEPSVFGGPALGSVNLDGLSATFFGVASLSTVVGLLPEAINVAVDIKPGDNENTLNLGSEGTLPVAVLSTSTFDARTIDPASVRVAGAGAKMKPNGRLMFSYEDVNGDGLLDLLLHVDTQALDLKASDTQANLTGLTTDGIRIVGHDAIKLSAK